jgi:hypothetical protein
MPQITLSSSDRDLIDKEWQRIDDFAARAISSAAMPSVSDLTKAHKIFFEREKRDVFYRTAILLMPLALSDQINLSPADVLEILLQTWNMQFYRYHPWNPRHHQDIERLIARFEAQISDARARTISSCVKGFNGDEGWVLLMFAEFRKVLGPVGAAKSLHLLAPEFFPLWETTIAREAYVVPLDETGYIAMMRAVQVQEKKVSRSKTVAGNFLKLIDEYNYCRYKKGWLRA